MNGECSRHLFNKSYRWVARGLVFIPAGSIRNTSPRRDFPEFPNFPTDDDTHTHTHTIRKERGFFPLLVGGGG